MATSGTATLGTSSGETIAGSAGNDIVFAQGGNDTVLGSAGTNQLYGGDGNDVIFGGTGRDQLCGGSGQDTFHYLARADSGAGLVLRDTIADFQHGVDKIDLSALGLTGDMISLGGWYGGTSAATAYAQLLQVDFDRNGTIDFEIQLNAARGGVTIDDIFY